MYFLVLPQQSSQLGLYGPLLLHLLVRQWLIRDLHSSNFYTLPFYYCGHAISKTVSLNMKNMKNCPEYVLDSSKEASCCTKCKKKQLFTKYGFWKNQEKPHKTRPSETCQKPYIIKSWVFFGSHSGHQDASFELSKTGFVHFFIFFIIIYQHRK